MLVRLVILLSSFLFFSKDVYAVNDSQIWTLVRKNLTLQDFKVGLQGQWRFSDDASSLAEEQLNLSLSKACGFLECSFIYTFGTIDSYNRQRENRFAIEAEKSFKLPRSYSYQLRLRQEARDFRILNDWAHRFRIRNKLNRFLSKSYFTSVSLSSEFNFYLNSFTGVDSGVSSHRSILNLVKKINKKSFSISYIHDLQFIEDPDLTRHVLFFGFTF